MTVDAYYLYLSTFKPFGMQNSAIRIMLQSQEIFHVLTEEQWQLLVSNTTLINYGKNKKIYDIDEAADHVYFVEKGSVKTGSLSNYQKVIVKEIAYAGDFFGENIFSQGTIRKDFAETSSESKVFRIKAEIFKELVLQNAVFTRSLMAITLGKLEAMEERLQNFVFLKAKERIMHFLFKAASKNGIKIGLEERLINQGISHRDIAFLTDTSRQTVARVLNELKRDNLIHYGGGKSCKILIRDMVALERLSLAG